MLTAIWARHYDLYFGLSKFKRKMRVAEAMRDEYFSRFCRPQGDPEAIQRLAWRRSALRLGILLTLHKQQSCEELTFVIDHLNRAPVRARHRVLASPEMALYISAFLNGTMPGADIAIPVLTRVATVSSIAACRKFSWAGVLPLGYLVLGEHAIRIPGGTIDHPELVLQKDRIRLSSLNGEGLTVEVPPNNSERELGACVARTDKLELVDGWNPFTDRFDDGNLSITFEHSSRAEFLRVLAEAVKLIRAVIPAALEEMTETAQYLSPICPRDTETNTLPSFSSSTLPGVIFVGIQQGDGRMIDVRHLAESCVHEHLHNRLYLLDEALPLTIKTENQRSYFSPWKQTMRTIEGMLHAIYVFSHLAWFWHNAGENINDLAQYAGDNVAEQVEHLKTATADIDTAELTPAGHRILSSSIEILNVLTRVSVI